MASVGELVGIALGSADGLIVGDVDGFGDGDTVGLSVGIVDGDIVGITEGDSVKHSKIGLLSESEKHQKTENTEPVGNSDGDSLGVLVGLSEVQITETLHVP